MLPQEYKNRFTVKDKKSKNTVTLIGWLAVGSGIKLDEENE